MALGVGPKTDKIKALFDPALVESSPEQVSALRGSLGWKNPHINFDDSYTAPKQIWKEATHHKKPMLRFEHVELYAVPWTYQFMECLARIRNTFQPSEVVEAVLVMEQVLLVSHEKHYTRGDVLSWVAPPVRDYKPETRQDYALQMVNAAYRRKHGVDCIKGLRQ